MRGFKMNGMGPRDGGSSLVLSLFVSSSRLAREANLPLSCLPTDDSLGGELSYSLGASIFGPLPLRPHWPLKFHTFVNAGHLSSPTSCSFLSSLLSHRSFLSSMTPHFLSFSAFFPSLRRLSQNHPRTPPLLPSLRLSRSRNRLRLRAHTDRSQLRRSSRWRKWRGTVEGFRVGNGDGVPLSERGKGRGREGAVEEGKEEGREEGERSFQSAMIVQGIFFFSCSAREKGGSSILEVTEISEREKKKREGRKRNKATKQASLVD